MKIKRTILYIAMITFMVFAVSGITETTYAYWASTVSGANNTDNSSVTIGTWTTLEQWDPAGTYLTGDQVINNGIIYQAKKDNPTKEPGVDSGWTSQWLEIGPA